MSEKQIKKGFFFDMDDRDNTIDKVHISRIITAALALILLLIIVPQSCTIIHPNEVGIVKTMGKISRELPRGSGFNFKVPIVQQVTKLDMSPKTMEMTFSVGQDGAISKDMQTIGCTVTLVYCFKEDGIINYVTNFTESSLNNRFKSNTRAAIKEIIGQYSVYDLTGSTEVISSAIQKRITVMSENMPLEITQVNVGNWDWSDDFDRQIKETMQKTQAEKTALAEVAIAEANAQKQVKEAEAAASAAKAKAQGELEAAKLEAEAVKVKADADAYKNRVIAQNMQVEVQLRQLEIEKIKAEKWNGKEPGADATVITPNFSGYNLQTSVKN